MTKTIFIFQGKGGTYIASHILHKARKGDYKNDIIDLEIYSKGMKKRFRRAMTPYEAVIIANALLHAVTSYECKNKKSKGIMK